MRFLETLLFVFAAIYVVQLLLAVMLLAAILMFLGCLWRRPKEAFVLGLGVLLVLFLSTPAGLALVAMIAVGFCCWVLARRIKARRYRGTNRPVALLPKP